VIFAQIQPESITTKIQLYALLALCVTQVLTAAVGLITLLLQSRLGHQMNHMKDALVESTAKASYSLGSLHGAKEEQERIKIKLGQISSSKADPFDPPFPDDPPPGGGVGPVFDTPKRKEQVPPILNDPPDPEPA
jgi:hypothetical protein